MIDVKLIKKSKNNGSSNSSGGIATNGNGYNTGGITKEAAHAARADLAIYAEKAGTANEAIHAQEADHAKSAFDLDPDSPVLKQFLSRIADDLAEGRITFAQGLISIGAALFKDFAKSDKGFDVGEFVSGVSGATMRKRKDGTTYVEVDELYVRMKAVFESLVAVRTESLAGEQLVTPAGSINCSRVEELDDCWRCYFVAEVDGERIDNMFAIGDQARCNYFNAAQVAGNKLSNKFYWRLVTGVGEDYIDISKTDCAAGSDAPESGDVICQLGSRTEKTRQTAIRISTVLGNPPSITMLFGVKTYSLDGCDAVSIGVDATTGRPYMKCYGDFRFGAREGMAGSYLDYDNITGVMDYCGRINLLSAVGNDTLGGIVEKVEKSVCVLDLSNEMAGVACDAQGNVTGALPSSQVTVYKGGSIDTGWTLTKTDSGCSSVLSGSTLSISALTADTATVTVKAEKSGYTALTAVMNIYKVKPGAAGKDGTDGADGADGKDGTNGADGKDGAAAVVYSLLPSVNSVTRNADGTLSASSVTCAVQKITGDTSVVASNDYTLTYQRFPDGATGILSRTNGVSAGVSILADTESVVFELRNGSTILDRERVPVLTDVQNLELGGDNLLLNAGFNDKNNWTDWAIRNSTISTSDDDRLAGANILKIPASNSQGLWQGIDLNPHLACSEGEYYSYSLWAYTPEVEDESTAGTPFMVQVVACIDAENNLVRQFGTIPYTPAKRGVWERVTGRLKVPATTTNLQFRFYHRPDSTAEIWIAKPQLVRGTVLPDWAPSPYDYNYLMEALRNSGSFEGGLMLGSLIKLGYDDADGNRQTTAGVNGLLDPAKGSNDIAFWSGGDMVDGEIVDEGGAAYVMRHNGTGYFAHKAIRVLKDKLVVGDDVILDKNGLRLVVNGNDAVVVRNTKVDTSFDSLVSNFHTIDAEASVDVPLYVTGHLTTEINGANECPLGSFTVSSGMTLTCNIRVNGVQRFAYGDKNFGLTPLALLARVELRRGSTVVASQYPVLDVTTIYQDPTLADKSSGDHIYSIKDSVTFSTSQEGTYSLVLVFPKTLVTADGATAGTMYCSVKAQGTIKESLGNQTVIGSDGMVSLWGTAAVAVNEDRVILKFDKFGLMLDSSGIRKTTDGNTWTNI